MVPPMRVLSHLLADGPTQMAWDEALLEHAEGPVLRTYAWEAATVSLGYFQDHDDIVASLPHPMPLVRRITGGGAIWHEHEVTYALSGRLGHDGLPRRVADLYPLLHHRVAAALGEQVVIQAHSIGDRRYREEPRCFASPAADDLLGAAGAKILGSAGRARGERVLVHGSLKLATNPWDQERVTGCGLSASAAQQLLVECLCAALGHAAEPGTATAAETAAMDRIRLERYGNHGWVRERRGRRA
jgi:lipoate-protein ligase A